MREEQTNLFQVNFLTPPYRETRLNSRTRVRGLLQALSAPPIDILFSQELRKDRSKQKGLYVLIQF